MTAWRMFLGLLPPLCGAVDRIVFAQRRITSKDLTDEEVAVLLHAAEAR